MNIIVVFWMTQLLNSVTSTQFVNSDCSERGKSNGTGVNRAVVCYKAEIKWTEEIMYVCSLLS